MSFRFDSLGVQVVTTETPPQQRERSIALYYCASDTDWVELEELEGWLGRTAVITALEPTHYLRAMRGRLGVVYADTSTETIAAVALASGDGELVLPAEVAHRVATSVRELREIDAIEFDPLELDLLRSISRGESLRAIGERYFYSDRTIRRRQQSAFLKLGASSRKDALRAATKLGLLDDER